MSDLNKCHFTGRLTRDPELTTVGSGTPLCKFSMAINGGTKDRESTHFLDFLAWGKRGETIERYVKKGHRFCVTAEANWSSWENNDGKKRSKVEFVVSDFVFLQTKAEKGEPASNYSDEAPMGAMSDKDIPF